MNAMAVWYTKFFLSSSMRCLSLQSLTFIQFAPLSASSSSSSSSFPSTPSLNVVSEFLTKEFGFSSSQLTTVMRKRPELLRTKYDHTARNSIHILKDSGFTENQLKRTIVRNPSILLLKLDEQLKPKMEFLKNLGLAPQDMSQIISRTPRLLTLSIENNLAPRLLHLETLFGSKDHLCKALKRTPQLFASDFEKHVKPRAEYLKNKLGIQEGSVAFARALSLVISLSFETLENKTKNLASFGLAEEEIRLILRATPRVLQSSTRKIKEQMDFLMHTAGLTPAIVASRPLILALSVEKTLKPRYQFFEYLRTNPHCKGLPSMVNFLTLSEKRFLKYFVQYSTQLKSNKHTIS